MLSIAVFLFLLKEYNCYFIPPLINDTAEVTPLCFRRPINTGNPPEYFDWRDKGMVSPVRDQLGCDASWAFSAVANIESHLKIYLNVEERLSEQFLLDCDESETGCAYNNILNTYTDIVTRYGGVLREKDYYPYAHKRKQCRWELSKPNPSKYGIQSILDFWNGRVKPVHVSGFGAYENYTEKQMAEFIYKYGPLSAEINSASMKKYKGDIDEPTDEDCNPNQLDHAVLIVGYNVYKSESGEETPYWIIKNSWGTGWGDHGYYYLVRGFNACGINRSVAYPHVK